MKIFRWRFWLISLTATLAVACSNDGAEVPCDDDGDCADGQSCVEGFCRAENSTFNIFEPPTQREPRLLVEGGLDFFFSEPGVSQWLALPIQNGGTARLDIDDIALSNDEVFELSFPEGRDEDGGFPEPGDDADSFSPTFIEPDGDPLLVRVWFHPEDEERHDAELTIVSNDPDREEHTVELRANHASSCLNLSYPDGVDFQSVPVEETVSRTVQLTNCSSVSELELLGLTITDSADGAFSIASDSYPGDLPGETLAMSPMQAQSFVVEYTPEHEATDKGELLITSTDEDEPEMRIPLTGQGVDGECPEARIAASPEGEPPVAQDDGALQVAPLDTVHFSAEESIGEGLSYEWSLLETPYRSFIEFTPDAHIVDPDLWVDLAGRYVVELRVINADGIANCTPETLQIDAVPIHDVYVELEWWVTGIPEPEGGEGVDLDLHYLHSNGNWGSTDWSVFSGAPEQSWDGGQALVVIDDEWGEFPEVIVHDDPESGQTYDIGVHYQWDLWGFGTAFATVSVYLEDTLVWRREDQSIHEPNDLWHVGFVEWGDTPSFTEVDEMVDDHSLTSDPPDG